MKKICTMFCILSFAVLFVSTANAQSRVGKVFTRSEANVLFGKVVGSVTITVDQLREAVANADDYIYITIKHNRAIFTNSKRHSLIRNIYVPFLSQDEPMIVFSKSAVEDFLQQVASGAAAAPTSKSINMTTSSGTPVVTVERRAEVTSLSSGAYTLEMALACPPSCP